MVEYICVLNGSQIDADVAQLAEQLICNQRVGGSIPLAGCEIE